MRAGFVIGRIILGIYLLFSGFNGLVHLSAYTGYAASKGVPAAELAVIVAHLLLIFAAFSFLAGWRPAWGVAAMVVFLIPVTFAMHAFWGSMPEAARQAQMVNFTKNFALMAASLMFLAIPRPWPYSVEELGARKRVPPPGALPA